MSVPFKPSVLDNDFDSDDDIMPAVVMVVAETPAKRTSDHLRSDDDELDAEIGETPESGSRTEKAYRENGNSLTCLVTMSIGIKNSASTGDLIDITANSFKAMKVRDYKPKLLQLCQEIHRRWQFLQGHDDKDVVANNWPAAACNDWLQDHPITGVTDVAFLINEVESMHRVAEAFSRGCRKQLGKGTSCYVSSAYTLSLRRQCKVSLFASVDTRGATRTLGCPKF